MKNIKLIALFIALSATGVIRLQAQQPTYDQLKAEAEKLRAEGSYARAHEVYVKAAAVKLSADEKRWIDFRLADTLWRSQAATNQADSSKLEAAQHQLEVLVRDVTRVEDRDRIFTEVQESLGDFFWSRRGSQNWGEAWPHYQLALDWWAGSADLDLARARYLGMVRKMARPIGAEQYYYYGYYGNVIPLDVLENALKIAAIANDHAHMHFLLAMTLRQQGGEPEKRMRVGEEFEAALKSGRTQWHDEALYHYAEWLEGNGRVTLRPNGEYEQHPDYVGALALFRQLVAEYKKGESQFFEQAKQQIENISKPSVGVSVSNVFLPDSEIQFDVSWRNVKKIDLALYAVDLIADVKFPDKEEDNENYLQRINLSGRAPVKAWSHATGDNGKYEPGNRTMRLGMKLPLGAYVLEAKGGKKNAREIVLVTDVSLVLKTSGMRALVYFCNAMSGAPIAKAPVKLWERRHNDKTQKWYWTSSEQTTDADGLARFALKPDANNQTQLFASAALNNRQANRQAFSTCSSQWYGRESEPWRIYAFTDRAAYRPGETAQWKFIARRHNGSVYSTPANATIEFEVHDPRGVKVKDGKPKLNTFGSAWGSIDLKDTMALGEYRVTFWDAGRKHQIGDANLFRLEEYKLPEFKVAIHTPEVDGKKKAFRVGEKVEVTIQADYYFGGAVSGANVEVLVHQNPFYHYWSPVHEFGWYYDDDDENGGRGGRYNRGEGEVIKRETLKTDATGKATLKFETPRNAQQDFEYRIEARVTDASRREIVGNETVRVTRQRYYVHPRADHNLHRPQDKVHVTFKAQDANDQAVQAEGTVKVTRDYWWEIWIDPDGNEVKGDQLAALKRKAFPPRPRPGKPGWRLKFRGYQHDEVLQQSLKTNAQGEAELTFAPAKVGYYRVKWTSIDAGRPIVGETFVWVATRESNDVNYRSGQVQIIVDKDTFRVGQKAAVMLTAPASDRYVLFSIEGEDLHSYQLVHLTGPVKLIELPITSAHVPNIYLSATMVHDGQIATDTKHIVVPPTQHFLKVDVKPDRAQYQPRESGTLSITTRDYTGKPVPAEVALGLVDESVSYIQQDYAGDPRQFYFGDKRLHNVQTQSTFSQKSYTKLLVGANKELVDFREVRKDRSHIVTLSSLDDGGFLEAKEGLRETARHQYYYGAGQGIVLSRFEIDAAKKMPMAGEMMGGAMGGAPGKAGRVRASPALPSPEPGQPAVQVRSDFRSTAFWQPDVVTDANGRATVKVKYPDSLTTWKATARVATAGDQFGIATASARTKQPLIVRLQAPRFFVVGDEVTVSAVINNNTDNAMTVRTELETTGIAAPTPSPSTPLRAGPALTPGGGGSNPVRVAANSEARVDWVLSPKTAGPVKLKVTGRGDKHSDAMEKSYLVYEHGIEKFLSRGGKITGAGVTVKLDLPKRKPESTTLTVQIAPSLAVTMLDALPYLIDYPYGCTEQTMSRFLPTAIVAKTLKDLGLAPEDVASRVFGGITPLPSPPPQGGREPAKKKDLEKLDDMTKASLERLYNFQHQDGGWGWWKDGSSDHFMTAYVVWGLQLASDAGISIKGDALQRSVDYLDKALVEEKNNFDQQAWMLHAVAYAQAHVGNARRGVPPLQARAFDNLWENRDQLNAYTRSLLALSAHYYGNATAGVPYKDRAKTLIANLENGVKIDNNPEASVILDGSARANATAQATAHWGEDGIYWRWSDGGVEATAFALRALLTIDPQNKLVAPVTNWLIKNRRGAQWSNTRDTAIVVLALNDYLKTSGELKADVEYELTVNGRSIVTKKLTAAEVLSAPSQFSIDSKFLRDNNEISIRRNSGTSPLYFSAQAKFFSLEEPITPAGNEIFVQRQYYRLVNKPTLLKGYVNERQLVKDGDTLTSNDRVEVVLTIEAKNNYEYLVFEDLKPAGLEAIEIRSGESVYAKELKSRVVKPVLQSAIRNPDSEIDYTGRQRWVYQELRDRKVALFIDHLPEGVWELRYDLRAEVPGKFHALPVLGHAMYVPEIRCNGAEVRINVADSVK